MKAEIIAIGTELLLGQIVDTNSAHIAQQLTTVGLDLHFKSTVGDNLERLKATLRTALSRSDFIITTGGIGPTLDDVTREAVAEVLGRPLVFQPHLHDQIRHKRHGREPRRIQRAHQALRRMLQHHTRAEHRAIPRQLAGVIHDEQRASFFWDVFDATQRDAPIFPV